MIIVHSTDPSNNGIGVELDLMVYIAFDDKVEVNDMGKIQVTDSNGNEIKMSNQEHRASYYFINLKHVQEFLPNTKYTVKLSDGFARDFDGNLSKAYTFSFTTKE